MVLDGTFTKKKILLTGAAGGIGSAFLQAYADRYLFRLADRDVSSLSYATERGHELVTIDIANLEACQQACEGIDVVIHLAADPSPNAEFYGTLLEDNIKGTYNIFQAAHDQGCQRVVYASSIHAVLGYPRDVQIPADATWQPMNMYGVSKCFGEAVASYFAHAHGLSSIAIRIGGYDAKGKMREKYSAMHMGGLSTYVSERDLNQLIERCVEVTDVPFAVVQGLSNNTFKRMDITPAREIVGYAPQDNAFEMFEPIWPEVKKEKEA